MDKLEYPDYFSFQAKEFYKLEFAKNPDAQTMKEMVISFLGAKNVLNEESKRGEAVGKFSELARKGHLPSARELGRLCLENGYVETSLKWLIYTFQMQWIRDGRHDVNIVNLLQKLRDSSSQQWKKETCDFLKGLDQFINWHSPGQQQKSLKVLEELYLKKKLEPHLNKKDLNHKIYFIQNVRQEYFLTTEEMWSLADSYRDAKNYEKIVGVLLRIGDSRAYEILGDTYLQGFFGRKANGSPDYEKADEYLKLSQTVHSCYQLSGLYNNGLIGRAEDGTPNFEEAARWLRRVKSPESYYMLGELHANGKVGCKKDGTPNDEEAADNFRMSGTPLSIFSIGVLYRDGRIGRKADGTPNYEEAEKYFRAADIPNAYESIGYLYLFGFIGCKVDGTPNYEEAARYFRKVKTPFGVFGLGYMYLRGYIGATTDGTPNLEEAFSFLSQSLAMGYEQSKSYIEECEMRMKLAELNAKEQIIEDQASITALIEEKEIDNGEINDINSATTENNLITPPGPSDSVPPMVDPAMQKVEQIINTSSDFAKEEPPVKRHKPEKKIMSIADKLQKNISKIKTKLAALGKDIERFEINTSIDQFDKPRIQKPLEIKFLNNEVEGDYNIAPKKINELMEYIEDSPSALKGAGKPEYLKGKFMGHKGCISRRLDGENRLVYKVTGPREILILACKGHYQPS